MNVIEPRPQSSLRKDDDFDDLDRELENYIGQHEEQKKTEDTSNKPLGVSGRDTDSMEKGQRETAGTDKKERLLSDSDKSDNEDSEPDDYNLTEDQRRAMEELENIKSELGYPDEEPPEYDVKERLKEINEDLANDPTPIEKSQSKVMFKQNLVDMVAPPPSYSEDEEEESKTDSSNTRTQEKSQVEDRTDEKSETISAKKSNTQNSKEKVLIEREGQFELVNADDIRAQDLGFVQQVRDKDKENEKHKNDTSSQKQPTPPPKPRPATATASSRRNIRVSSAKQRPMSAGATSSIYDPDNYLYNSPYAMSPREKELMEERKKALEKHRKDEERRKKLEEQYKEKENRDAFEGWLKKKKEESRRKKIEEEEERKQNDKEDRVASSESDTHYVNRSMHDNTFGHDSGKELSQDDYSAEQKENEEAFKSWLKEKSSQFKKEKLLKRRQEQEAHDGYYVRSREDCDKAFRQWLKHKAHEARRARAAERMKARLHRMAARRTRKSTGLAKAIKDSQAFRYVDYYGYRF